MNLDKELLVLPYDDYENYDKEWWEFRMWLGDCLIGTRNSKTKNQYRLHNGQFAKPLNNEVKVRRVRG